MDNLGTVCFLGVGFSCCLDMDVDGDVLVVLYFCLEDGNCLIWYDGACVYLFLVDVVF